MFKLFVNIKWYYSILFKLYMKNISVEHLSVMAILLGIVLGIFLPEGALYFEFLGKIFLSLLKMLVLPIIILSLFLAITQVSDINDLKILGTKTISYYFLTTAAAVLTGLGLANLFIFDTTSQLIEQTQTKTGVDFIGRIFSTNIFKSLADGEILHIVVFVILFSIAFIFLEQEKKSKLLDIADSINQTIMKLIEWVLQLAPIGILSLVWSTISKFDTSTLDEIQSFFIATTIAVIIHVGISLPMIGKILGSFNAFRYFLKVKRAIIVALATASSAATLPISIKLVEKEGVIPKVSRFVLPVGATLNMDGSALYQALLTMLFVSLSGIEISLIEQLLLFLFIVLSSAGTAGIPSGGIVMMTMVIQLLNIPNPEYYLGLYIMVDRFWDYPITAVNVWGDLVGAKTVNSWIQKTEKA